MHVGCTSGDNKIDAVPDPDDENDVWFCHTCYDMQVNESCSASFELNRKRTNE